MPSWWAIKRQQSGPAAHTGSPVGTLGNTRLFRGGPHLQGVIQEARSMAAPRAWLLCLLLLALVLSGAASRAHQHSMETRAPDINPAWYTGRGIRPVGRFGRRRTALRDVPATSLRGRLSCLRLDGGA